MLLEFLSEKRDEIIARSKERVARRTAPRADRTELEKGIPLFLTQLAGIFRQELAGKRGGPVSVDMDAASHGAEMLRNGLTVAQVIHDYGDICQVVTELAAERHLQISAEEYSTFNRCLDEAMAAAVSEYLRRRERMISDQEIERLGALAHEQRNLLGAAMLALQALRSGRVGLNSKTGDVLTRSLIGLRDLTERSLAEVRFSVGMRHRSRIDLAEFLEEMEASAALEAHATGKQLTVTPVLAVVAVEADRQLLASAVGNLLNNAFKFSRPGGHVTLRASVDAERKRIVIDVEDECGGLPPGRAAELFGPFEQRSKDRSGLGLGLTISRQAVAASGGLITIRDIPGKGCVFSIELPAAAEAGERSR